ncbi:putative Gdt1 family protein [Helianthus anomalus]
MQLTDHVSTNSDSEELAKVEAELDADIKSNEGTTKSNNKLATIGLAAAENPMGVVIGGIIGQALCQTAVVFGGKSLGTQISERFVQCTVGRDYFHYLWNPIILFNNRNMSLGIGQGLYSSSFSHR